jgi:hypothetical protein
MAKIKPKQHVLFAERFLDRYAGPIISDPAVAIVELVANAWDAYATRVEIQWPKRTEHVPFLISDNGKGMTPPQFVRRWSTLDYNRAEEEGDKSEAPEDMRHLPSRRPYGRNGRGRHAAFKFSDPYRVRTWTKGIEVTYEVSRGVTHYPSILRSYLDGTLLGMGPKSSRQLQKAFRWMQEPSAKLSEHAF